MARLFPLPGFTNIAGRARVAVAGADEELRGEWIVSDALASEAREVRFRGSGIPHSGILETGEQERNSDRRFSATILLNRAVV